jgi:1-deoxy-D-xylulose-5-phosphate synthase
MIHDVALQNLHVVFILDRAGLVGADGPTHHGSFDLSFLRTIPKMIIMAPSDENELRDMVTASIDMPGPVAIRYPRGNALACELSTEVKTIPIGKPIVIESGSDILLLGAGFMLQELKKTASILRTQGKNPTLVDARFIKPLDENAYEELLKTHSVVVTLEDNTLIGGYGSAIAELMSDKGYTSHKLLRFGLPDDFVEHGNVNDLYKQLKIDGESVAQKLMEIL